MRRLDARYALWGVALLALAALPAFAGFVGLGWELSVMAGLAGLLACIILCGSPIRPRDSVPPTLMSLRMHSLVGWAALMAVAAHIGGLLLADATVIEYLKPSAPLYQLAGIGASAVLCILVVSSIGTVRRRFWSSHRDFQATHVILGCLLAVLSAVHVLTTNRYVGGRGRRVIFLAATAAALLTLLRSRRPSGAPGAPSRARRQLVFGRHSSLVLAAVGAAALLILGLSWSPPAAALRESLVQRAHGIALDFPHGKHTAVNCLQCHHNYADGRGFDRCIGCHQSSRADLKEGVEARFHGFCFDCHRHPPATAKRHGPVSGCVGCHQPPDTRPP
ncbi:MAG: cytochrome c3 family protein [Steroidobacteraceae bacterium]